MIPLFNKTKDLVLKIDNFIDMAVTAGMHLRSAVSMYMEERMEEFEERVSIIRDLEKRADDLKRDIVSQLHVQTLIPELRGDVLEILEGLDRIIDRVKYTAMAFSIEKPVIPDPVRKYFCDLVEPVFKSIEALTFGARAYFYQVNAVRDHLNMVSFYEKESDSLSERLKRDVFARDLELGCKIQLKYFIIYIDSLSDDAENVSGRLSIATIKRIV